MSSTHLELLLLLLISLLLLEVVADFLICLLNFLAQYFFCSIWVFNVINLFRVVIGISSDIHKARCGATDWRRSKCILVVI